MENLLLEPVEYQWEETASGLWRRYVYPDGRLFAEYQSRAKLPNGWPLVHFTRGKCPDTGRLIVAKGGIAIGRLAVGGIAIGHASAGIIAFGQASAGLLFGLGQATCGLVCLGQLALGGLFGLGQAATGAVVIAQIGAGYYGITQIGYTVVNLMAP
ncbi:MAG: hypothetical protein GC168_02755 [Candidatus Hydrogenedens sp.]|nr:hypothetical protein [Candidatus Hydrogenedens sp.]